MKGTFHGTSSDRFFFIIVYTGGEGHSHSPISFRARVQIAKPLLRSTELRQGTCSEFRGGTGGILHSSKTWQRMKG